MAGTLFVVATPIGNLEDLTFRALRTLREVDLIAAEDTRRTSKLLAHYDIHKSMVSLHEHNEAREAPRLVDRLRSGESIALVSDAGTPAISDPGAILVRKAREAGLKVVPIPGASAVTAALSASGLAETGFTFLGFPPSSGADRKEWLATLVEQPRAVVFFESPHRIVRTMAEVSTYCAERPKYVFRELSKEFEEFVEWPNAELAENNIIQERGEFVVVIGPKPDRSDDGVDDAEAVRLFGLMTDSVSLTDQMAARAVAAVLETSEGRVRKAVKKARIAARRAADAGS
jgi:16S rRNA (cytidine1402-2'-O)-methyltransferase